MATLREGCNGHSGGPRHFSCGAGMGCPVRAKIRWGAFLKRCDGCVAVGPFWAGKFRMWVSARFIRGRAKENRF
jgi:hypothetical protein